MSKHKDIYFKAYNLSEGDFIPCAICGKEAVDIHAIEADGMGGGKRGHRIENLIPLCREHHIEFGDKKQFKKMLFEKVKKALIRKGLKFAKDWIDKKIEQH